ncbi:MAG: hypothetical protein IPJ61_02535 [Tessaracoccus sp.]|uniref:serpin family protein n=1 Tax=Tessaracoccus sp. TaxID=1971211 RepID=UPI001ECC1332|nr:serpin family protein [Tessaracoccus sp.]MBK7819965.1 hypothetical protein [Tessaracoccus sp.]
MTDDPEISRALHDAASIPEVPTGLLAGAHRRRTARRRAALRAGGVFAIVAAAAVIVPVLPLGGSMPTGALDSGSAAGGKSESQDEGVSGGGAPAAPLPNPQFAHTEGMAEAATASEALAWSGIHSSVGPNRILSPSSLSLSLAVAAEGAGGASLASANAALGLEGETRSLAYGALRQSLEEYEASPGSVDLDEPPATPAVHQANRLVTLGVPLEPSFLAALDRYFAVPVEDVERSVAQANLDAWVREETGGLIERSGVKVQDDTVAVIQDALLFAAAWRTPLEDEDSVRFDGPDGDERIPGVSGEVEARMAEGARWTAVRLPYDDTLAADVILPREGVAPLDLTAEDLAEARAALDAAEPTKVWVRMPTFDLAVKTDLLEALPQVDLSDLSGMGAGLTVDQWVQQARLRVTARGTVGAAVTEIVVGESAQSRDREFVVDRPYVLRVLDTRTGWPLFLAAISDPKEQP